MLAGTSSPSTTRQTDNPVGMSRDQKELRAPKALSPDTLKPQGFSREEVETLEIQVASVHDVERSSLRHNLVEDLDIVDFAVGNADKRWDIAMEVEQCVHLDGCLVLAEPCPREQ